MSFPALYRDQRFTLPNLGYDSLYKENTFSDSDGGSCREYLVKWKGYETEESTWEPRDQLTDPLVREKIKRFKKRRQ